MNFLFYFSFYIVLHSITEILKNNIGFHPQFLKTEVWECQGQEKHSIQHKMLSKYFIWRACISPKFTTTFLIIINSGTVPSETLMNEIVCLTGEAGQHGKSTGWVAEPYCGVLTSLCLVSSPTKCNNDHVSLWGYCVDSVRRSCKHLGQCLTHGRYKINVS